MKSTASGCSLSFWLTVAVRVLVVIMFCFTGVGMVTAQRLIPALLVERGEREVKSFAPSSRSLPPSADGEVAGSEPTWGRELSLDLFHTLYCAVGESLDPPPEVEGRQSQELDRAIRRPENPLLSVEDEIVDQEDTPSGIAPDSDWRAKKDGVRFDIERPGFNWQSAFKQSMLFLTLMHAFRLATEDGTRAELKGPFFKDYFTALKNLKGWRDGDPFIVNYIGHPMQGAVSGYIQIHNDPKGIHQEVSLKSEYWKSRLKAMGWSALFSTQFEIGLLSEASLGNIGKRPYRHHKNPMAYVDLVVTPTLGTVWLIGEDVLDKYLVRPLEERISNGFMRILIRGFLNPSRAFANLLRGKRFWHRDDRK